MTDEEKVAVLNDFFCNRLLLKRFRKDTRDKAETPQHVLECERAFDGLARKAVAESGLGRKLDAMEWVTLCTAFSSKWIDVCHWISPKKLREFFTAHINAEWLRVDEVPSAMEQPPVDLKWYKNPEGCTPVQPCLCPLCNVVCNSLAQYKAHSQGRTHRSLARAYAKKNGGKQVEPVPYSGPQSMANVNADWGDISQTGWAEPQDPHYRNSFMTPEERQHFPGYPNEEQRYTNYMIWQQQNSVEADMDIYHQQQYCSSDCGSVSAKSDPSSLLDSVSPVHVVHVVLDDEARDVLSYVRSLMAQLQEDESVFDLVIKQVMRIMDRAELHIAAELIDAAVNGSNPDALADVAARLCETTEGFRATLGGVVEEMVGVGFGECVPAQASSSLRSYLNVVYQYHFSTTFNEYVDMKSRHKYRALARFAGCLVNAGVLESLIFQKSIEKLCSNGPSTEDFYACIQFIIQTSSSLTIQSKAVLSRLLKKTLKASWYPARVHNLASTLFVL
eukprot:TRINITY_DN1176_c0_g1_i1.p1 TRINITY_DN1176_c0_g1~~TRINITY_DN1176_c0_g1_i1.p1  ORF type:complete len:540 (+),score=222.57 TRINITY_DN1176_c0_g1_i1:114-1622(+)